MKKGLEALSQTKVIGVIGTLDTKGEEILYVRKRLEERGHRPLVIDVGVLGDPSFRPDIDREEVARAGGGDLGELVRQRQTQPSIEVMSKGVTGVVERLYSEGRLDGLLALGGAKGTAIAAAAMRALPVGVPKLLISTAILGDVSRYLGVKDITMMPSAMDLMGLNRITRRLLDNGVGAIVGMVEMGSERVSERTAIGISSFGVTTPAVMRAKSLFERHGYEVMVFGATGVGGRALEEFIDEGLIDGVLDLTTSELADELVGGELSASPERLEAAGKRGIPQVIAPGALDMVNFGPRETVPPKFKDRKFYQHTEMVTLMRTTEEENAALGRLIANKANKAKGPVGIVVPLRGFSALDKEGGAFYSPEADEAFLRALKQNIKGDVEIVEVDCHINDPQFAEEAVALLLRLGQK